jgi:tetratricopeptide (TPR) repeat protein
MPALIVFRVFFLLFLSSFLASEALAQRDFDPLAPGSVFEISGQVRSVDNKAIENVMVRIETHSGALVDQITTDSMGRFRFSRLRQGQYRVSATATGVISPVQTVDISRSSPRVHIFLQLVPEQPTFGSAPPPRGGVIDARVPAEARTAFEKGRAALSEKKSNAAISYFKKAVEIYPGFHDAHMSLGRLYMDAGDWEKAEGSLRQAVKTDPKSVTAMVSLGEVYRRLKKYSEGEQVLAEALKVDNNSWEINFTLGRIHWELKDIVKAGRYVARAIELQPNVAESHLLAGNIFVRAGLPAQALIEYEEYLRLAPNGEFSAQTQALVAKLKKSLNSK